MGTGADVVPDLDSSSQPGKANVGQTDVRQADCDSAHA